jgi:hypothetical protein
MFIVDWRLYVACYYPTTPTDYPSTTKGTSVGPPVAVNFNFWALVLSEVYSYSMPLTTFLGNNFCSFHRPVLIFHPQWTAQQAINKGELCLEQHYLLKELHSCYVSTYKSGFLEGFRRWRGSILTTEKNPDLHGSCSLPKHCSISDRSEQNSSKLRHTACNVFRSCLALES